MQSQLIWRLKCLVLSGALLAGCSGDPMQAAKEEPSVQASGVLTFQGKPLPQYEVVLMPTDGRRPAIGVTDAAGKFVLGTNEPGDGAPAGKSKVAVVWAAPESADAVNQSAIDDPRRMPRPDVPIPRKYNNPETSGIEVDIPAAGINDLKIELK